MMSSHYVSVHDRVGWYALSWRIYLVCLATSFLVMIEPAPTDLFFVLAFGAMMLAPLRPVRLLGPVEVVAILVYLWFTLLSLLFADYVFIVAARAVAIEIYLILLFLMTAYFARIDGDRAFRMILLMLVVGGIVASLVGILAWANLLPGREIFFRDEFMTRIKSTFKDPNVLGPYLIPSILLMIWTVVAVPRLRIWAGLVGVLLVLCLVLTFSRGAWIHMLATALVFFVALLVHRGTALPALLGAVAALAVVLAGVLFFADAIFGSISDSYLSQRLSLQSYDEGRFEHIITAMIDTFDQPLGIGPNQSRFHYGFEPHNTFVVLALQNGVFAALGFATLYLAAMVRCLVMVLRRRVGWMKYAFVLAIMSGLLVLMNVVGSLHWRHLYVVMGLAYGSYHSNSVFRDRA